MMDDRRYDGILYRRIEQGEPEDETYKDFMFLCNEIYRLRKALEKIAKATAGTCCDHIEKIADEALKGEE